MPAPRHLLRAVVRDICPGQPYCLPSCQPQSRTGLGVSSGAGGRGTVTLDPFDPGFEELFVVRLRFRGVQMEALATERLLSRCPPRLLFHALTISPQLSALWTHYFQRWLHLEQQHAMEASLMMCVQRPSLVVRWHDGNQRITTDSVRSA